jgi:hypothetical protein
MNLLSFISSDFFLEDNSNLYFKTFDLEIKIVLNNGRNKFSSVAHVGYGISPLSSVKLKILNLTLLSGEIS